MIILPLPSITDKVKAKIKAKTFKTDSCWLWQGGRDKDGRGTLVINYKRYKVPRIILFLKTGNDPGDLYACHSCHNPRCVNPDHIHPDTQSGNIKDAITQGTRFQPNNEKLTEEQKCSVKLKKLLGWSVKKLADEYKVCTRTIYGVLNESLP